MMLSVGQSKLVFHHKLYRGSRGALLDHIIDCLSTPTSQMQWYVRYIKEYVMRCPIDVWVLWQVCNLWRFGGVYQRWQCSGDGYLTCQSTQWYRYHTITVDFQLIVWSYWSVTSTPSLFMSSMGVCDTWLNQNLFMGWVKHKTQKTFHVKCRSTVVEDKYRKYCSEFAVEETLLEVT